jgi:hypothetical protein
MIPRRVEAKYDVFVLVDFNRTFILGMVKGIENLL